MTLHRQFLAIAGAILLTLVLALPPSIHKARAEVDHGLWNDLLQKHVQNGRVNYDGMQQEQSRLDQYLDQLAQINPDMLERSDALAYYINLYNAWTIKLILSKYPDVSSIKDLGTLIKTPWKKRLIPLNGEMVTLDHIEHDIIRPGFKDPRIHFAVNCAAVSCPPLQTTAFTESRLNEQLDHATTEFINDPQSTCFKEGALYLSRIFKWFGDDFNDDPAGFVKDYANGDFKKALAAHKGNITIEYLDYNWKLNRQ